MTWHLSSLSRVLDTRIADANADCDDRASRKPISRTGLDNMLRIRVRKGGKAYVFKNAKSLIPPYVLKSEDDLSPDTGDRGESEYDVTAVIDRNKYTQLTK
ncbi:uncharacterized protein UHOR_01931 [Ustilago hordei]|uniref:Uncharacterized protein n=1 Tax=Ustilago hordei TaxID=120017 RepID=I2G5P9_USTHO|nr:uncharacterized protein UHOR_01931 [Ustilago hordei]